MSFNQPTSVNLPTGVATKMAVTRQAGWPVWCDQVLNGNTTTVTWSCSLPAGNSAGQYYEVQQPLVGWWTASKGTTNYTPGVTNATTALFRYPVLGVDNETGATPYVYVPPGANLYFVVVDTLVVAQAITARITYDYWSTPGEVGTATVDVTLTSGLLGGSSGAITIAGGGWVRPGTAYLGIVTAATSPQMFISAIVVAGGTMAYTGSSVNSGQANITGANATCFYPLVSAEEFVNSPLPWFSTRTTAVAMLGTNVTQVLNKAGTILGGRIPPAVTNMWAATQSYVNGLHPAEKAWLPLETGVYTYCPPSTDLADFWDYTLNTSNTLFGPPLPTPVYRLDNASLVNVMYVTPGATTETLAVTASWHLEFRTSSALFQIALSGLQLESLHQAQLGLASAGFFFDNIDHRAILARVIAGVKRIMPPALAMLRTYNPTAGRVAQKAYRAMTQGGKRKGPGAGKKRVNVALNRMRVLPTDAKKSGIVTTPKRQGGLQMYLNSRR